MKRFMFIGILLGTILLAATPASAQRFRSYYYGGPYTYAPQTTYWGGYYPTPSYTYQPYTNYYYSYPQGPAWGYPRYYSSYPTVPYYYYGW